MERVWKPFAGGEPGSVNFDDAPEHSKPVEWAGRIWVLALEGPETSNPAVLSGLLRSGGADLLARDSEGKYWRHSANRGPEAVDPADVTGPGTD